MESIEELRRELFRDNRMIPIFIDTRSENHHKIWDIMRVIFTDYSILISNKILNKTSIDRLSFAIMIKISDIKKICDLDESDTILFQDICDYIFNRLNYYMQQALSLELYEVVSNIKKYYEQNRVTTK